MAEWVRLEVRSLRDLREAWEARRRFWGEGDADGDRRAWNSWCYQFHHMGCGAYAAGNGGRRLVVVMKNRAYAAPWASLRCGGARGRGLRDACEALQRRNFPPARRCELRPDERGWALNGPLLDNWAGSAPLFDARLEAMLAATARAAGAARFEVMLNRRDYPQVAVGLADPFAGFAPPRADGAARGAWLEHARPTLRCGAAAFYDMLPVLSQYTAPRFADTPVPPLRALTEPAPAPPPPWEERRPAAIFRGSATSPHPDARSQRLRAYELLRDSDLADVRLTGLSARFRVRDGAVHATDHGDARWRDVGRRHFLTLDEQARRCRWALYLEGNAGADRLGALLAREFLVIAVASDAPAVSWLRDGTLRAGTHYLECPEVEALPARLAWCAHNPDACRAVARAGHAAWRARMRPDGALADWAAALAAPPPPPWRVPDAAAPRGRGRGRRQKRRRRASAGAGAGAPQRSNPRSIARPALVSK